MLIRNISQLLNIKNVAQNMHINYLFNYIPLQLFT